MAGRADDHREAALLLIQAALQELWVEAAGDDEVFQLPKPTDIQLLHELLVPHDLRQTAQELETWALESGSRVQAWAQALNSMCREGAIACGRVLSIGLTSSPLPCHDECRDPEAFP